MTWVEFLLWGLLALSLMLVGLMFFFNRLAENYQQRMAQKMVRTQQEEIRYQRSNPPPKLTDEMLSRDRVAEKKKQEQLESGVMIYNPDLDITVVNPEQEQVQIVDVAKPVGFWSEFVMKQKMGFILAKMSLNQSKNQQGYWVNLIKAQDQSQSKDQKRGR